MRTLTQPIKYLYSMTFIKYTFFGVLVLFLVGCQGDASSKSTSTNSKIEAPDMTQVTAHAKGLCECATPMLQLKEQLEQYKKEGNLEKLQEILEKSSELGEQQGICQDALEAKFGKFDKADSSHIQVLKTICPTLAASYTAGSKEKD